MKPPPPPFDLEAALARLDTQMAADIRSLLALGNPHYGPGAIAFAKLAHARCWTTRQAATVLEIMAAAGHAAFEDDIPF